MHYRNGRKAWNGDMIVQLEGSKIKNFGVLQNAVPGNDYCNGNIVVASGPFGQLNVEYKTGACLCDCLHIDDVAEMLKEKGLDKRPEGK